MDIAARRSNNLPNRKHQTDELTSEFYQRHKGKIISILYDIFQKTETERLLLTHSDASITVVLKSDRRHYKIIAAAAAAKSLQSCPTLCDPWDSSPPGSPVPGILQARTLEWVAISFSNAWKWKVKVKSLSRVWLFATLWIAAYQASLSFTISWSLFRLMSRVSDVIQPSHPLSPSSSTALSYFQHQGLFQRVGSSYKVAKVLELQL